MASLEGWNFTIKLCPRPFVSSKQWLVIGDWSTVKAIGARYGAPAGLARERFRVAPSSHCAWLFFKCGGDQSGVVAAETEGII
jgi:hypothetical protein